MTTPRKNPHSAFNATMTRALFQALDDTDFEHLEAIIEAGADLEARNADGLTPLLVAAENRSDDAVAVLIKMGANINAAATTSKKTALHYAAKNSDTDTLKTLLRAKPDINSKDSKGQTPLHYAAIEADDDHVNMLVAAGADILAKDNLNRTAGKHAERKAQDDSHYLADRYRKIATTLILKEISAQKEQDRIAAADAERKTVQNELEQINKNFDTKTFKLKPPPKK